MKVLLLALAICASPLLAQKPEATVTSSQPAAHVKNRFTFTVNAPLRQAAPLFGPEGERAWAGDDWNPEFVFPVPAQDIEGAVFIVPSVVDTVPKSAIELINNAMGNYREFSGEIEYLETFPKTPPSAK